MIPLVTGFKPGCKSITKQNKKSIGLSCRERNVFVRLPEATTLNEFTGSSYIFPIQHASFNPVLTEPDEKATKCPTLVNRSQQSTHSGTRRKPCSRSLAIKPSAIRNRRLLKD
jgi:hypothetical protein